MHGPGAAKVPKMGSSRPGCPNPGTRQHSLAGPGWRTWLAMQCSKPIMTKAEMGSLRGWVGAAWVREQWSFPTPRQDTGKEEQGRGMRVEQANGCTSGVRLAGNSTRPTTHRPFARSP